MPMPGVVQQLSVNVEACQIIVSVTFNKKNRRETLGLM